MSNSLIAKAFETALKAWADAQTPAIPVAWENVTFIPPSGRFCSCQLLPAQTQRLFVDGSGRARTGIFQVTFYMPIGTGAGTARSLAESLDNAFSVTMTTSGFRIFLTTPFSARVGGFQLDDRFVVPVDVEYKAVSV